LPPAVAARTKVSDICLPLSLISKSHVYLTWNEDKTVYALADAGTTNGTTVEGKRLVSNVATALADGFDVAFGPYKFKFFLPAGFYAFMQARLGARA
jgi:pSer/pThr/pTyr-binding forkhead associated (FHA) protein